MSHFICPHCDTPIMDSPRGYVTGCEHYPAESLAIEHQIVRDYQTRIRDYHAKVDRYVAEAMASREPPDDDPYPDELRDYRR